MIQDELVPPLKQTTGGDQRLAHICDFPCGVHGASSTRPDTKAPPGSESLRSHMKLEEKPARAGPVREPHRAPAPGPHGPLEPGNTGVSERSRRLGVRSKWNRVPQPGNRCVSFVSGSGRAEAAWAGERNDPSFA